MLAGVLTAEYGLGIGRAADVGVAEVGTGAEGAMGVGVAAWEEAGDGADFLIGAGAGAGVGGLGGSGGGVKMPRRCLASRSFSNLAALAAARSC